MKLTNIIFFALVVLNIFLASWYALNNDVYFISDIARDMYLLAELEQKKLVLLGPRSSVSGLFHGPLWTYVSFPGYFLGKGNPVIVGWYWIFLISVFLITSYSLVKKLFGSASARLFVLMTSLYLVYHANNFFNPYGALFLVPAFYFFFVRYLETLKVKYLIFHVLVLGGIIQFQMAIGLPFLLLSFVYSAIYLYQKRKLSHLTAYSFLMIPLSTFIFFDLRHNFVLLKNLLRHLNTYDNRITLLGLVTGRLQTIANKVEFLRYGPNNGQLYASLIFYTLLISQIRNNIHRTKYLVFLFFYLGFFLLSLASRFELLSFYIFPLYPFVFLIFSSFITSKHKQIFMIIFFTMYLLNTIGAIQYLKNSKDFIGKSQFSWKGLNAVARYIYESPEQDFGYFVYAPDILGYAPRYALDYGRRMYRKNASAFAKKPVTYLIIEPFTQNNPFTSEYKFKESQIHITKQPSEVKLFDNGYKVEKYFLNEEEINMPFDPGVNPGLHYR